MGDFAGLTYCAHLNEGRRRIGLSFDASTSTVIGGDARTFDACVVLGIGGVPPVAIATLPMNHDWAQCQSDAIVKIDN